MSFGRASKYDIWSGIDICHLVGIETYHLVICHLVRRRNMSFGRASKYVHWSGVELCHLVGLQNMSFGRRIEICHSVIWLYVIWSGVEICHLVGRRIMSFGRTSNYVIWSPHRNMSCKTGPLEMHSTSVSHPSKTDEILPKIDECSKMMLWISIECLFGCLLKSNIHCRMFYIFAVFRLPRGSKN